MKVSYLLPPCALLSAAAAAAQTIPNFALDHPLTIDRRGAGGGPALLAAQLPASQRQQATRMFEVALNHYRELERRFGLAPDEPAGALATFLTGNFAAYHDRGIADPAFAALVKQLRAALAADLLPGGAQAYKVSELWKR